MIRAHVLLFAAARQLAGTDHVVVECPEPATVADLRAALAKQCPPLEPLLPASRIAVDGEFASDQTVINTGMELAVIPPVSGG